MDRHGDAGPQQRDGARPRAPGRGAPGRARSPAPDRHERDVELAGEVAHPVEEVGVAEERQRASCPRRRSPRPGVAARREAAPVVLGGVDRARRSSPTSRRSPGTASTTAWRVQRRTRSAQPGGAITRTSAGSRRSEGRSRWSWWAWEISTAASPSPVVARAGRDAADVADPRRAGAGRSAGACRRSRSAGGVADVGDGVHRPTQARRGSRAITRMRRSARQLRLHRSVAVGGGRAGASPAETQELVDDYADSQL